MHHLNFRSGAQRVRWLLVGSITVVALGIYAGYARTLHQQAVVSGCEYRNLAIPPSGAEILSLPQEIRSTNGIFKETLQVKYADHVIAGCSLHHRSYNGRLTGSTWRVKPGDTLRVNLRNDLPDGVPQANSMAGNPAHRSANGTNLHTHGLHVSPEGNSDNPFINVEPGQAFDYEIHIPKDHPPGTHWYHPHLHGGTAVQLSSGMAGALIVEGGLDEIPEIKTAKEQVLVLQQITYDESGQLEDFHAAFGLGAWSKTRRLTLVNGQIAPTINMRPGEVQRWRIVHAGSRENISLRLQGHALNEIATDGIALGRMVPWVKPMLLAPGYRTDVLVRAASPATSVSGPITFDLMDDPIPAADTLQGQQSVGTFFLVLRRLVKLKTIMQFLSPKPQQVLAHVVVSGEPMTMPLPTSDSLSGLAPFKKVSDSELNDTPQRLTFDIDFARCDKSGNCVPGCVLFFEHGCKVAYLVNGREFNPAHRRTLQVGQAAEWTIDARIAIHPFHIHVNPFETSRIEPDGRVHLVWKDTLQVSASGGPVKLRMRYADFTGTAVLHCHVLDHEDQGMMEVISIEKSPQMIGFNPLPNPVESFLAADICIGPRQGATVPK